MDRNSNVDIEQTVQLVETIYGLLQRLIGLHRQLYDYCRDEKEALLNADVQKIQEITKAKQLVVESIKLLEIDRIKKSTELSLYWKIPLKELTLQRIANEIETDRKTIAEGLVTALNVLRLLVQRTEVQNTENQKLVSESMLHINQMKNNILGEAVPKSDLYGQKGQSIPHTSGARLLSKEV